MRNYQIINDSLFTGGFVMDCDEKNIEDKDIVKEGAVGDGFGRTAVS